MKIAMNIVSRFVGLLLVMTICSEVWAQQDLMVSQQFFSRVNINPAGTGNNDKVDVFMLGRLQWAGVDNSPKTLLLNATGYAEKIKSSFGLTMNMDAQGIDNMQTNVQLLYSYHIDLTPKYILSLGLSGGVNIANFDPYNNIIRDEQEYNMDTYTKEKEVGARPDFNAGAEITSLHWLLGFSCTHILSDTSSTFAKGRHFYVYARGFIPVSENFDIAPALSYMHKHKTNNIEVNCMLFFQRMFWGGITWKPDMGGVRDMDLMGITLGLEWRRFRFGYTYDFNFGRYNNLPSNTHEVLLSVGI